MHCQFDHTGVSSPIVATSTTYVISPAFNSNSGEGMTITYEFPGVAPGFSYRCNLDYLHDIACLQLKLWWGDDYHIWIPRSSPRVLLSLQPRLLTWYRLPSTQTLVRGWLSHMNSKEYPPGFSIVTTSTTYMISPAFNSNSGGGLTITYEFPGLCSMSAEKNGARKNCSLPRKWFVHFRCKFRSVFSTGILKNTRQFGKKSLLIFDWHTLY